MYPAGDQIVACAFWCGLGENRSFNLEKSVLVEVPPGRLHQPVAEDQVPLELRTTEIQHPVAQPQLLCRQLLLFLPGNRNRGRLRRSYDPETGRVNLHLPRR
jgi:hypothetical protein